MGYARVVIIGSRNKYLFAAQVLDQWLEEDSSLVNSSFLRNALQLGNLLQTKPPQGKKGNRQYRLMEQKKKFGLARVN